MLQQRFAIPRFVSIRSSFPPAAHTWSHARHLLPVTRIEFLLGKQLPYVGVALTNFAIMLAMAVLLFNVPIKGSLIALVIGAVIYVMATTAYGMVISSFASTQIAALFGTSVLTVLPAQQFAGMMTPVSALSPLAQIMGRAFPMTTTAS